MPDFKGFFRSTAILIGQTVRHWLIWISAGLASLTSWATWVYGVQPPAHRYAYAAAAILLALAFCWTFHLMRVERDKLLADTSPKFKIVFEPKNEQDSRPYLQALALPRQLLAAFPGGDALHTEPVERRYRVGIVNLSAAIVPNVTLKLESSNPAANFIYPSHYLQVMDSDSRVVGRDLPPSNTGDPTLFFDVVKELGDKGRPPREFTFCYASETIEAPVPGGTYEIVLKAEGGNVSAMRRFRIRKSWNPDELSGPLIMEAI